jgi:hypothetical protein
MIKRWRKWRLLTDIKNLLPWQELLYNILSQSNALAETNAITNILKYWL